MLHQPYRATAPSDAIAAGPRTTARRSDHRLVGRRHTAPATRRDVGATCLRVACLTVALVPAIAVIAPVSDARAASYSVWACADGSGSPLGVGSWVRGAAPGVSGVQTTCGEPSVPVGGLFARARAVSAEAPGGGGWVLAAAQGTRITGLDVWWSWQAATGGAIRVYALGNAFLDPSGALDPFDGKGRCCNDSAFVNLKPGAFGALTTSNPSVALGQLNHQSFPRLRGLDGRGVPIVGLAAGCVSGCDSGEPVAQYQAYRIKAVLDDASPPAGRTNELRDGLRVGSDVPINLTASDVGGGVREITLRVDGHVVQALPGGGECADVDASNADPREYGLVKPCPSTLSGQLILGAAQMPDNQPHELTAVVSDAAGQDTVLGSARVALAAPPGNYDPKNGFYNPDLSIAAARRTNGAGADPNARLTLGFERGHRTVRKQTIGYSTRARIRGTVRTARNKAVTGARVWVASRLSGGEWQISRKPLTTSRKGVVSARLPARTPNRDVRLLYFPYSDRNDARRSARRDLRVQATTTIQSDQGGYRNGDTLVFTGQVIKKHLIPSKSVYLQAIVRGRWRTFATTQADSNGRWRMTHLFEATRRPTRYTFRAVVPSQTGYAWATGHSRSLRVLVTP